MRSLRLCSSFASTYMVPKGSIHLIDSTGSLGLLGYRLSPSRRIELTQRLFDGGIKHLQVGNINCNEQYQQTNEVLETIRDLHYGNKTISTNMIIPTSIYRFLHTGADELVIPTSVMFPYAFETLDLFRETIQMAVRQERTVRLQINDGFSCPDRRVLDLCKHGFELGCTHFSILDSDRQATPSEVSALCKLFHHEFGSSQVAFGFRSASFAMMYTALDEGFTQFHSCIGGLGGFQDTKRVFEFLQLNGYTLFDTQLDTLHETHQWLMEQT